MGATDQRAPKKARVGGAWQLKTIEGEPFGSESLKGHYYLLYFGGTLCPDVCPLTLHKMQKAQMMLNRSSEGKQYIQVEPVFVTTNPEYDTPERLAQYKKQLLSPDFICLRADSNVHPDLLQMLKAFKVPVGLSEQEKEKFADFFAEQRRKRWFW